MQLFALDTAPASPSRVAAVQTLYTRALEGLRGDGRSAQCLPLWMKGVPGYGGANEVYSLRPDGELQTGIFPPLTAMLRHLVHEETGGLLFCNVINIGGKHWWGRIFIRERSYRQNGPVLSDTSYYFDSVQASNRGTKDNARTTLANTAPGDMEKAGVDFAPVLQSLCTGFPDVGQLKQSGLECGVLLVMAVRCVAGSLLRRSGEAAARRAADELDRILPLPLISPARPVSKKEIHLFRQHLALWFMGQHVFMRSGPVLTASQHQRLHSPGPRSFAHNFCYRQDQGQAMQEWMLEGG
jgi:hypothetical protein